jgi:hypothetical protein
LHGFVYMSEVTEQSKVNLWLEKKNQNRMGDVLGPSMRELSRVSLIFCVHRWELSGTSVGLCYNSYMVLV